MLQKSLNQKGFSLVELMVVVAIIGILAAIAVPQMTKFQAKARQSEAKTQLTGLFTAEKAFHTEYGAYHSHFAAVGFTPEGNVRYNIGFTANANPPGALNGYTGAYADAGGAYAAANATTKGWCAAGAGGAGACTLINGADNAAPPDLTTADGGAAYAIVNSPAAGTPQTFLVGAKARLVGSNALDAWSIDQNKTITNTSDGINTPAAAPAAPGGP